MTTVMTILRYFLNVDVPALLPMAILNLIMSAGSLMNVGFEKAYLMQTSLNIRASEIIATYVYKGGVLKSQIGLSTAVGLFQSVIGLILVAIFNRLSRKVSEDGGLW